MGYDKKFLICILQHRNSGYAITSLLHLIYALHDEPRLRSECKIVIAASSRDDHSLKKMVDVFSKMFDIDIFECNPSYPDKIREVIATYPPDRFEYFIKNDEDVFLSPDSWRKLLQTAPNVLKENDIATVSLSTGIPTWSYFAKTFFDSNTYKKIFNTLTQEKLPENLWGNDYSSVNAVIGTMTAWDEERYWHTVNTLPYDYKGIHPVRLSLRYSSAINEAIIATYTHFLRHESSTTFEELFDRYFCNSFFIMNYRTYEKVFNNKSFYVDAFDEIPINRHLQHTGASLCVLRDSLGIHVMYNTAYQQKAQYRGKKYYGFFLEDLYTEHYCNAIRKALENITGKELPFSFKKESEWEYFRKALSTKPLYQKIRSFFAKNNALKQVYRTLKRY